MVKLFLLFFQKSTIVHCSIDEFRTRKIILLYYNNLFSIVNNRNKNRRLSGNDCTF